MSVDEEHAREKPLESPIAHITNKHEEQIKDQSKDDNFQDRIEYKKHQHEDINTSIENWKTFLSRKSFSEEEDNYLRVSLLLVNTGTKAVHTFFVKQFSSIQHEAKDNPVTLQNILYRYQNIIDNLKKTNRINDAEWKLIFPKDQVDTSEFDISLMTLLLTTFDSEGIIKLKEAEKNALEEIRKHRNEILAHKLSPTLYNNEMNTIWDIITQAIQHLVGDSLEQECYMMRNATLDCSNTEILDNIIAILHHIKDFASEDSQANETIKSLFRENDEDDIPYTDNDNFVRLCTLLIRIAPIAVRYLFKTMVDRSPKEMRARMRKLNVEIDWESCLDDSAIETNEKYDHFNVPSMLFLLKHCWELQILDDKLPRPSDTSVDADLTRINYYTQLIVDNNTKRSLDSTAFNDIWINVSEAISRLGDVHMKQQCECLRKSNIEEKNKDIMLGLIEVQQKMKALWKKQDELKECCAELHNRLSKDIKEKMAEVDKWNVEDEKFVETRASILLLKRSKEEHIKCITVYGSFGIGKTFTIRHVALILRKLGYRIVPVSTLSEIEELDDEETKTLFVVEDFCGRTSAEQRTRGIRMWKDLKKHFLGSKSKIVVSCSSMIYQHYSFKRLSYFHSSNSAALNMNSTDIALNYYELRSISKVHADMNDKLIKKYSNEYPFFPFLCKQCSILFEREKNIPQVMCNEAILKNAKRVYKFQLKEICREDEAKYAALALLVQLDNYVKDDCFEEDSKDYIRALDKINTTLVACQFYKNNSIFKIKEELKSMVGSYIVESTDSRNNLVYSAKNLDLYEILVSYFKEEMPEYFSGAFHSRMNYSKLCSFRTILHKSAICVYKIAICVYKILICVYKRTTRFTSLLYSWRVMIVVVAIGLFFLFYVTLILKGLEDIKRSRRTK